MGGVPPLGYDVLDRKLVVNETEAELVRLIFKRFLRVGSATKLAQELRRAGHTTKSWTTQDGKPRPGKPIDKGAIYKILNNRVYLGEAMHKGTSHPGEHAAIIDRATWDKVHAILASNTVARSNRSRAQTPALLRGLIFAPGGHAMTPSHTRKSRQALPLLCRHRRHPPGLRGMPGAQRAGGGGRGGGRCAGAAPAAHPRGHRPDMGGGEERGRRCPSARSSRPSPTSRRCGTSCSRPSRRASFACWSSGSISSPDGLQVRLRAEGLQTLVEELQSREVKAA